MYYIDRKTGELVKAVPLRKDNVEELVGLLRKQGGYESYKLVFTVKPGSQDVHPCILQLGTNGKVIHQLQEGDWVIMDTHGVGVMKNEGFRNNYVRTYKQRILPRK